MPLPPLHEQIVRVAMAVPGAPALALAGGGAMLAYDLVDRPTRDVDLFSNDPADVDCVADALTTALRALGHRVQVDRHSEAFIRLIVTPPTGAAVTVELAVDARLRPTVEMAFGRVLDRDELAADKTLALFGRAASRDLVDVHALTQHGYTRSRLLELAAEKDPGFRAAAFLDALRAAASHADAHFERLGLSRSQIEAVRELAADWRHELAGL